MSSRAKKNRRLSRQSALTAAGSHESLMPSAYFIGGNRQAAGWSSDRGQIKWNTTDSREEMTSWERTEILRRIHFLKAEFGFARGLIKNSADLVGWHVPQADSGDEDWDELAEERFRDVCGEAAAFDVAGKFDFETAQPMLSRGAFTDGHIFTVLTKWKETGAARFAFYEASQLRNPKGADKQWVDGVKISRAGRHLAYGFKDGDTGEVIEIPAASVIYFGEFDTPGEDFPVPPLAHAVLNSTDILEIWGFQKKIVKTASLNATFIERDATAVPPRGRQGIVGAPTTTGEESGAQAFQQENVWDGGQFARLGPGEKAKILTDNRPSSEQRQLILDLKRDIAYGWGLPLEVVDAIAELTGPGIRFVLDVAGNWIECRRKRQQIWLRKVWRYVIACEIAAGRLALPKADAKGSKGKWWKVGSTGRRLLTIDRGKESRSRLDELAAGVGTEEAWEQFDGTNWKDRQKQKFAEVRHRFFLAGITDPTPQQIYDAAYPPRQGAAANPNTPADTPPADPSAPAKKSAA